MTDQATTLSDFSTNAVKCPPLFAAVVGRRKLTLMTVAAECRRPAMAIVALAVGMIRVFIQLPVHLEPVFIRMARRDTFFCMAILTL